jgi:hypothetical protein
MPFIKGNNYGNTFKKGQSGNPKGQPKKVLSRVNEQLKEEGYSAASANNIVEAYSILINLDEERIKSIISDNSYPMLMRIVAKEMLSKNGAEMIEKILDRAHGKAIQKQAKVNKDGEDVNIGYDISKLSAETIKELLNASTPETK